MKQIKKTPLDLLDDIYSLAYWMTGSESVSHDLVNKTYLYANTKTRERELLKTFRRCYVDQFGQYTEFCISGKPCKTHLQLIDSISLHCHWMTTQRHSDWPSLHMYHSHSHSLSRGKQAGKLTERRKMSIAHSTNLKNKLKKQKKRKNSRNNKKMTICNQTMKMKTL